MLSGFKIHGQNYSTIQILCYLCTLKYFNLRLPKSHVTLQPYRYLNILKFYANYKNTLTESAVHPIK